MVRKAVQCDLSLGAHPVHAPRGTQFVIGKVRVDGSLIAGTVRKHQFSLETDGRSLASDPPCTTTLANEKIGGVPGATVPTHGGPMLLVFPVDVPLGTRNVQLEYHDNHIGETTWSLDDGIVEQLRTPEPRFELQQFDVPSVVIQGETVQVNVVARNVSEVPGRFLGVVRWPTLDISDDDEAHAVERNVQPGDTVNAVLRIDTSYTAPDDMPITVSLEGHVRAEREIDVRVPDDGR